MVSFRLQLIDILLPLVHYPPRLVYEPNPGVPFDVVAEMFHVSQFVFLFLLLHRIFCWWKTATRRRKCGPSPSPVAVVWCWKEKYDGWKGSALWWTRKSLKRLSNNSIILPTKESGRENKNRMLDCKVLKSTKKSVTGLFGTREKEKLDQTR